MASTASPLPAGEDVPVSALSRAQLIDVLTDTVGDLENLDLSLSATGVEDARRLRSSLIAQIRDHVLPRLADADIPAIVVVGGSTGAGKSTLVNSVLGREVSDAGVLRPTTRTPVLVVNPEDSAALAEHPIAGVCRTVTSAAVPAGLALVDASDLDSVQESNRVLASRLLEAADLWLFITTAARYGDHTPWASLEEAAGRETPIGVVLNRVPTTVLSEVRRDLVERLDALGLAESPFFVVPDAGPHEGLLPEASIAELRDWLGLLAGRHRAAGLVRRTGRGLWTGLRADLITLADGVDAQDDAATRLETASQKLLEAPAADLRDDVERGTCGQGAPTTRWVTLASTGGPLAPLAQGGKLRSGWFGRTGRARAAALATLAQDARESVAARLEAALVSVHDDASRTWEAAGAGSRSRELLPDVPDAAAVVGAWATAQQEHLATVPKGLTPQGAGDLVVSAAAGIEGSRAAAERLGLGPAISEARQALAQALTGVLSAVVPAGAARGLAPDPALAAALRLRAGELTPFTRPGATA
ncbi:ABC transporter [Actinomyces sp. 432]|uniref:GTPase domain-containing protein n=1 Tax=unclassified Actinomyces TaxID=2609248 RepID=UPI001374173D|nr:MULTISPECIES: GTPase domain-containing protein [unclassified Actinomyces]MBW3069666.1 ABC transporter [Actinomyces sp. 594]QHO91393.1 ABC transporter [Actinomyces sp. 432]